MSVTPDNLRFYKSIQDGCTARLAAHPSSRIYRLGALATDKLYNTTIATLFSDATERIKWNCNACRDFVTRYTNFVVLSDDNRVHSLVFNSDMKCEGKYVGFIDHLESAVKRCVESSTTPLELSLVGDLFCDNKNIVTLGQAQTGAYRHMACNFSSRELKLPAASDYTTLVPMLERVLVDNNLETLGISAGLITANELSNASAHKHVFAWIMPIAIEWATLTTGEQKDDANTRSVFLWRHIGTAYPGVVNSLRSGATSILLESVRAKDAIEVTRKKWNDVTNPVTYRMPTAAPTEGNMRQAIEILAKMGVTELDMARTFFTYGDAQWADHAKQAVLFMSRELKSSGVTYSALSSFPFASKPETAAAAEAAVAAVASPAKVAAKKTLSLFGGGEISLHTFLTTIVPLAIDIDYKTPDSYTWWSLITGAPGSVPIMQHHSGTNRTSWYTYPNGRTAASHGLISGAWTRVHIMARFPNQWSADEKERKNFERMGNQVMVGLDRAHDSACASAALFDTLLDSKLHSVRSSIHDWSVQHPATFSSSTLDAVAELSALSALSAAQSSSSSFVEAKAVAQASATPSPSWRSASISVHPVCGIALGLESQNKLIGGTHIFRVTDCAGVVRTYTLSKFE